jgi:hypothetical protein
LAHDSQRALNRRTKTIRDKISRSFLNIGGALVLMVTGAQADSRPVEAFGKVALAFVANSGQTDEQVKFIARSAGGSRFSTQFLLTQQGAVLLLNQMAVRMTMIGANPDAPVEGLELLPGKSNYLIGNDRKQWRTDVPNYGKVRYREAWPGVDVVYYGNQRQLEYDFVIKPGADPDSIRLRFEGAEQIEIDGTGELVLRTSRGEIRQHKPVIYQEAGGVRKPIQGGYELLGENKVRFRLSNYDRSRSLVIDPILAYSTFLGGSGRDLASAIAVDSSGAAYVTGTTLSPNFPVVGGAAVSTNQGVVFVSKLNSAGTALVYSTEISGPDNGCEGSGIAVDALGNAYVTGNTASQSFPTVNAIQGTFGGVVDAFIFKLNPSGNGFIYSTYVGGSGYDSGMGIAVDSSGNAYITAMTQSFHVPTSPGAFRGDLSFAGTGTFVTKLNSTGGRVYTTLLDPKAFSFTLGNAIAADNAGNAYVTGYVGFGDDGSPPAFPTTPGAFQTTFRGGVDAFVTKLNPAGTALVYSTFLGGSGDVQGAGIAVDASGAAYVVGSTNASDFPGPISGSALTRATDAFIVKLNPAGTALVYGRYLGGIHDDYAKAVSVDAAGNAYVTGSTSSPDFPLTNALQTAPVGLGGPIFRSALNPSSWLEASAGIVTDITQIVVHPRIPSLLYAVGPSGRNSSVDIIYKSTDSGATWSNSGFPTNLFTFALFFDPSNPSILYQVAATGVFKSTNAGASWIRMTGGLPVNAKGAALPLISTYAVDTVNTNILYLGLSGSTVYVTTNGGVSWSPVGSGLPSSPYVPTLSTDPFIAKVVYATVYGAGVFKSTDAGRTWTLVYNNPSTNGGSLKITAPGTGYLYNSFSSPLLKMTNGGSAWTLANFNGPRVTTVAADLGDPNKIYLGTTTGVYATADGGNTWARLGLTLASSSVMDIEIDPTNTANLYAAVVANIVPYVAKVNGAGTALVYSTYLAGGAGSFDQAGGTGISVDNRGDVYVTGESVPSFPTTPSAIYPAPLGDTDSFIAKIGDATAPCPAQVTAHNSYYPAGGTDFDFVNVIAPAGCAWTASANNSWLTIVAGASGVGTGQVYFSVAPNLTLGRGSSISVNDGSGIQSVNVTQAGELCSAPTSTVLIGQTLNATLTRVSCPAGFRGPSTYYTDEYLFSASAGQQVAVKLNSTAFDAFLYVQDPDGNIFTDADSGGGTNSRIPAHNDFLNLASGMYTIAVTSQRAGGVGDYTLSLTAGGPGLVGSSSALAFTVPFGSGSVVQTVNVTFNGSPVTITSSAVSTASGKTWLQVLALNDAAIVTVNPSVLPAGASDTGSVTLFTPSGQLSFQVSVTIGSDNTGLVATPSVVTFDALSGSETVVQNVNVTFNGSPATVTGVGAMTTTGEDWLLPSLSDTPGSVTVGVNSSALSPGSYTGSVIVNTTAGTVTISVNITVSA